MKAVKPTKAEVAAKFEKGFHCAHCSLSPWADALGYDEEELYRISGAFGGGMFRGDTCGGVSGSLMAIGMACGGSDPEAIALAKQKTGEFQKAFTERFGSTICRELIGYDMSIPGEHEKADEAGVLMDRCPELVSGAVEILNEILADVD